MNVFDICRKFQYVYMDIKRDILVQKIKVTKIFFIYHFSGLTLIILLFISLDREMDSLSFDI